MNFYLVDFCFFNEWTQADFAPTTAVMKKKSSNVSIYLYSLTKLPRSNMTKKLSHKSRDIRRQARYLCDNSEI